MNVSPVYTEDSALYLGITEAEAQAALLDEFRSYIGLAAGAPIPDDPKTQAAFLEFLRTKLTAAEQSEAINALSPTEVVARRAVFEVLTLVLRMLRVLQQCMKEQADLLAFYTDWQKEYTDMLADIPTYGPEGDNRIIADSANFGKTTLGYGHITVQDVAEFLMNKINADATYTPGTEMVFSLYSQSCTLLDSSSDSELTPFLFRMAKNADDGYTFSLCVSGWTPEEYSAITDLDEATPGIIPIFTTDAVSASEMLTGQKQKADLLDKLMASMTTQWNLTSPAVDTSAELAVLHGTVIPARDDDGHLNLEPVVVTVSIDNLKAWWANVADPDAVGEEGTRGSDAYYKMGYGPYAGLWGPWHKPASGAWPEMAPYEGDYDDDDLLKIQQAAANYRAEVNAQLQQYIESAQARSSLVQDRQKTVQSAVDQTKDALSAQAALYDSIIESLRSIITGLFK